MNRKAVFLLSILVMSVMFIFAVVVGNWRDQEILQQAEIQFERKTSAYLKQMSEGFRSELLQDNIRLVRNTLSALRDESFFGEYAIFRQDELIDDSPNFRNLVNNQAYHKTIVPVHFTTGGDLKWGEIHYLTAREQLRKSATRLRPMLFLNSILISGFTVAVVWLFIALFWRSGELLLAFVDSSLAEAEIKPTTKLNFIWKPLLGRLSEIISNNKASAKKIEEYAIQKELSLLAAQVAHDIRSPLSALKIASNSTIRTPESEALLKASLQRIEDIAQNLLEAWKPIRQTFSIEQNEITKPRHKENKVFDVSESIKIVATESQMRMKESHKISIDIQPGIMNVSGNRIEFQRAISNILNNAMEAISLRIDGEIRLYLRKYATKIEISVLDNGCGIPAEIIAKLGKTGVSLGKGNQGNGLGLAHAKHFFESCGGKLQLTSSLGAGTNVSITLPIK